MDCAAKQRMTVWPQHKSGLLTLWGDASSRKLSYLSVAQPLVGFSPPRSPPPQWAASDLSFLCHAVPPILNVPTASLVSLKPKLSSDL